MVQLSRHFDSVDGRRKSDWARLQRQFAQKRQNQERQKQLEDRADEQETAFGFGMVVATELQIAQFNARLDTYDTATVTALMENQAQLDAVRQRLDDMLAQAYVMEDGRRVFKTEDGTQVFDEHGESVSPEELDFGLIGPDKTTWENFSEMKATEDRLKAEKVEILEYQEKLDSARERVADGDITEAELEELDAELLEDMPPSVKVHVRELAAAENTSKLQKAVSVASKPAATQTAENTTQVTPVISGP